MGGCLVALFRLCAGRGGAAACLPRRRPQAPALYEWHPEGLFGEPSIVIDLHIAAGGDLYWRTVCGLDGRGDREGRLRHAGRRIHDSRKVVDKYSTLYGRIVDADGNTVNADADARRHKPAGGREVCFMRRCLTGCA